MQKLIKVHEALKNLGFSPFVNELTCPASGNRPNSAKIVCVLLDSHYFQKKVARGARELMT